MISLLTSKLFNQYLANSLLGSIRLNIKLNETTNKQPITLYHKKGMEVNRKQ